MSRWFRFYDDTLNDPKTLRLSDKTFRIWVGILCAASKNEGKIPLFEDLAILLRMSPAKLQPEIEKLIAAELIDHDDDGMKPHNWDRRQYKSDVSTDRVKRFRNGKRNVSVTPPDTEADTEADTEQKVTEANASGADAPPDVRTELFRRGLDTLARMSGKTPSSVRALVGKWLKACNDEAIHVLAAIDDAATDRVVDPVPWIERRLQPKFKTGSSNAKTAPNGLAQALGQLREHNRSVGGGEEGRGHAPRLLPHG